MQPEKPLASNGSPIIRFGPGFELDPSAWQLRRDGKPLKLERIPMQILLFLGEQPGQLVSREQIVEKIWGKNAYLDTDNSINGAMRKIRQALQDDSAEPRYIETVTGLGYRFIAPISSPGPENPQVGASAAPLNGDVPATDRRRAARRSTDAQLPSDVTQRPRTGFRAGWLVLGVAVVCGVLGGWIHHARTASLPSVRPGAQSTLAVLPLTNLTGDPSQEYFSDGLTEELIAQLGNADPQHLSVIARTSVMNYKNTHEPLDQVARVLGAQYLLEGSVRRDANKIRVTAQLVRAADQSHVWSHQYDRELTSVLALEAEIATAIADEIRGTLGQPAAASTPVTALQSPEDNEAHDLYLRGLYFWNKRSLPGFTQALTYFKEAIAKSPGYAPAYAGLADTYAMLSNWGLALPSEAMASARTAARRAIELDPQLAEAHNALAVIAEDYDYDWTTAGNEFRRAIQLNPNYATAHQWYGIYLAYQGRFAQALAESDRARALDPLSPIVNADRAVTLLYARQYPRAIDTFLTALEMDPRLGRAHMVVVSYVETGRYNEALAHVRSWRAADPGPWTWAEEAFVYGRAGEREQAAAAIQKMQDENRGRQFNLMPGLALAYAGIQDKSQVLDALEGSFREHSSQINEIKVAPQYDFLHDDPQFRDLVRRVGLTP